MACLWSIQTPAFVAIVRDFLRVNRLIRGIVDQIAFAATTAKAAADQIHFPFSSHILTTWVRIA